MIIMDFNMIFMNGNVATKMVIFNNLDKRKNN